jgi:hypothetical protein
MGTMNTHSALPASSATVAHHTSVCLLVTDMPGKSGQIFWAGGTIQYSLVDADMVFFQSPL